MSIENFHHLPLSAVWQKLDSQPQGLSSKEAVRRLKRFGLNELPKAKIASAAILFLRQFANPLIYILLFALLISFLTGHLIDSSIILTVILISAAAGFFQEYKASRTFFHLREMIKQEVRVYRDGRERVLPAEELVAGDVIFLVAGEKVPADGRLIETYNLEVIEAALTGESLPSSKILAVLPLPTPLAERENMVYAGTIIARGQAKAMVAATGRHTELGKVASLIKEAEEGQTPLQKQLWHFSKFLSLFFLIVVFLVFIFGLLTGRPLFEMVLIAVAVAVAAVPEGLLPALTIILAIGMQRLSQHKGLVRKMLAAETLGSVSVICSDKTGTLTQGEMRVAQIITETTILNHDGRRFSLPIHPDGKASHIIALKIGLLCNNAVIENPQAGLEDWHILGDPTEKALLLAARQAGLAKEELEKEEIRVAEIPFESEHKYMAALYSAKDKRFIIYAKGAPERILNFCSLVDVEGRTASLTVDKRKEIKKQYEGLARGGLRVLAVAYRLIEPSQSIAFYQDFSRDKLNELIFVGLIALKDPLRPEAKEMVALCQQAGIRPVIITGDHRLTAAAIASELGLPAGAEHILEAADLDKISEEELKEKIKGITVFARVEPRHKIRIVSAWQARGEVVAMTGDGVNDAPALKKADIGVAVGSGTDVAKETADLILLDNNFQTIVEAVRRGRIILNNIRKVILYCLTGSFTEVILIAGAIFLGLPLPLLPAQILWIKLIEDTTPAVALAFDEIDEGVMKEKPRQIREPLLPQSFKKLIIFYALIMDLALFGLFYYLWKTTGDLVYVRTMIFVGLGIASLFYIFAVRGLKYPFWKTPVFGNRILNRSIILGIVLFLAAIYLPFLNRILQTVPLGLRDWAVLVSYGMLGLIIYEIGKKLILNKQAQ